MPLGQAFAFAFGVAFVVLGLLYVTSRAAGRDRTASVLSALLTGLFVSMMVWVGTFALLMSEPNVLIGVGMAILAYASAFRTGFGAWRHLGRTSSLSSSHHPPGPRRLALCRRLGQGYALPSRHA